MCWNSGDGNNVILVIITGLSEQGTTSQSFTLFLYPVSHLCLSFWHIHYFSHTVANTWPSSCCCGAVGVSPPAPGVWHGSDFASSVPGGLWHGSSVTCSRPWSCHDFHDQCKSLGKTVQVSSWYFLAHWYHTTGACRCGSGCLSTTQQVGRCLWKL